MVAMWDLPEKEAFMDNSEPRGTWEAWWRSSVNTHGRSSVQIERWRATNSPRQLKSRTEKLIPGDFPGGPVVQNPPRNAGDIGSIPGLGAKIPLPWSS